MINTSGNTGYYFIKNAQQRQKLYKSARGVMVNIDLVKKQNAATIESTKIILDGEIRDEDLII